MSTHSDDTQSIKKSEFCDIRGQFHEESNP